jgi:hypothetical protein
VLLGLFVLVGLSLPLFWRVSRCGDERLRAASDTSVVAHSGDSRVSLIQGEFWRVLRPGAT